MYVYNMWYVQLYTHTHIYTPPLLAFPPPFLPFFFHMEKMCAVNIGRGAMDEREAGAGKLRRDARGSHLAGSCPPVSTPAPPVLSCPVYTPCSV
jgi:hypothetical protein